MTEIDKYLSKLEPQQKAELERVRKLCKQVAPESTETISYGVPTLKYQGKMLLSFNAYPHHIGLYPGAAAIEELKDKLDGFELSKGTIRYTLEHPISDALIKQATLLHKKAIDEAQ